MQTVSEAEKNRALSEVKASFPLLPHNEIVRILSENEWNVDHSIESLFAASEREEQRAIHAREEEKRSRYLAAQERACAALEGMLTPEAKIRLLDMLEENEGDVEETVDQFLRNHNEPQKTIEQQHAELAIACFDRVPNNINRTDVDEALQQFNWDLELACADLLKKSQQRKIQNLRLFCQKANKIVSGERLEQALISNDWDVRKAHAALMRVVEEGDVDHQVNPADDFASRSIRLQSNIQKTMRNDAAVLRENLNARVRDEALQRLAPKPNALERLPPPVVEEEMLAASSMDASMGKPSQLQPTEADDQHSITISLSANRLDRSDTLSATWQSMDSSFVHNSYDWIGLYKVGANAYTTYQWVKGKEVQFALYRAEYGEYLLKYISNKKQCLAVSPKFKIGPVYNLTPILSHKEKTEEPQVVLKIEQKSGDAASSYAWVGMYQMVGNQPSPSKSYYTYQRWNPSNPEAIVFQIPKAGIWEFRLFPSNDYQHAASCIQEVNGDDRLHLRLDDKLAVPQIFVDVDLRTRDIAKDSPWIGVYKVNESSTKAYRRYKAITVNGQSTIQFKAPIHTGEYEVRLFADGDYSRVLAKSNSISIVGI